MCTAPWIRRGPWGGRSRRSVDELEVGYQGEAGAARDERARHVDVDDRVLALRDPADLAGEAECLAAGVHGEAALRRGQRPAGEADEELYVLHSGGGLEGGEQVGAADVRKIDLGRLHRVREHRAAARH